jgi:hypothetical protein
MTQKKEEITEGPLRAETQHDPKKVLSVFHHIFFLFSSSAGQQRRKSRLVFIILFC